MHIRPAIAKTAAVFTLLIFFGTAPAVAAENAVPAVPSPTPAPSPSPGVANPCNNINAYITRPSVTNSACTVAPGDILIENGWSNQTNVGAGAGNLVTYPQTYVRLGTKSGIELDITPPTAAHQSLDGSVAYGTTDAGAGLRYTLYYTDKFLLGANVAITGPSGSPAFTAHAATYTGSVNLGYTLTSRVSLYSSLIFNSLATQNAAGQTVGFGSFTPTLNASYNFAPQTWAFVELSQASAAAPGVGPRRQILYGLQRTVGPQIQLDAEAANNYNALDGSRFHYVGLGLSFLHGS